MLPVSGQRLLNGLEGVAYVVSPEGLILGVGGPHWDAFAFANGGASLAGETVLGRDLFGFIAGESVRQGYRDLLARLGWPGQGDGAAFPYRCDGPGQTREMRMCIAPLWADGRLEGFLFQSLLLAEDMRPPVNLFDFQALLAEMRRVSALPKAAMCSCCQLLRWEDGIGAAEWVAAEEWYRRGGASRVQVSHTLCPACAARYFQG